MKTPPYDNGWKLIDFSVEKGMLHGFFQLEGRNIKLNMVLLIQDMPHIYQMLGAMKELRLTGPFHDKGSLQTETG